MTGLLLPFLLVPDREWRRQPAPGVEYRMIVQDDPKRVVVALRFAPDAPFRATSALARDEVYDLTPNNGRATLTERVGTAQAVAGLNGDFFQWGDDPGGDPVGLMVRNGELISHPEKAGADRGWAYGWGAKGGFVVRRPSWKATSNLGPLASLNAYTAAKGLTLSTPAAGYAIGKKPTTFLVLNVGPRVLTPRCDIDGRVTQVVEDVEKLRVNPGTMVLSSQSERETLRAARPGQKVHLSVRTDGFDWRKVDNVVGGGPLLVRNGQIVAPDKSEFDTTRHPRTVVGADAAGGLWAVVIDGRQTQSVGASLVETAAIMRRLGCVEAMNLDGGGSSTISLFGMVLNRPSGGVERAIGNAVLWHGPRSQTMAVPLRIVLGSDSRLALVDEANRPFAPDRIVWSAQGKAWADGDGLLHTLGEGETTVRALVDGRLYETRLTVKP